MARRARTIAASSRPGPAAAAPLASRSGSGTLPSLSLIGYLHLTVRRARAVRACGAAPCIDVARHRLVDRGARWRRCRARCRRPPIRCGSRRARSRARPAPPAGYRGCSGARSRRASSRAVSCSASFTRTTTCGHLTRLRKQPTASAAISANGSLRHQLGRELLGDRDRHLDRLGLEFRFHRFELLVERAHRRAMRSIAARGALLGLGAGFGRALLEAARKGGGLRLLELGGVVVERHRRLRLAAAGGEVVLEQEFGRRRSHLHAPQ